MTSEEALREAALARLRGIGNQGPRSEAEQQQAAWEADHYRNWPDWAVELDRKLNEILRKLDNR